MVLYFVSAVKKGAENFNETTYIRLAHEDEAWYLSLTANAAALYHDAAAIAPGSGTEASFSPET